MQIRESGVELRRDEVDEDRATDPGPENLALRDLPDDADDDWGSELELQPTGQGLGAPGTNLTPVAAPLRARPRRTAPVDDLDERTTLPTRFDENARPEPVAVHVGVPLFSEEVAFGRRAEPAAGASAPRRAVRSRWLPWLLVGALAIAGAVGWSLTHSTARPARSTHRDAPAHDVR